VITRITFRDVTETEFAQMGSSLTLCESARPVLFSDTIVWDAARTRSRAEKQLTEYLGTLRVPCFLPLVFRRRVYGGRVRESEIPLFPGYVFFDSEAAPREQIFASRKVAQILTAPDPAQLRSELANLARALQRDKRLREAIFGTPGSPVYVARGKLKGLFGKLIRYGSHSRLLIEVSFLGKAAELAIDEAFVEPIL